MNLCSLDHQDFMREEMRGAAPVVWTAHACNLKYLDRPINWAAFHNELEAVEVVVDEYLTTYEVFKFRI